MGGFFGAISKRDCVLDIFFGVDYHSHLGNRRGGMAIYDEDKGFQRQIHNIENSPFRTVMNALRIAASHLVTTVLLVALFALAIAATLVLPYGAFAYTPFCVFLAARPIWGVFQKVMAMPEVTVAGADHLENEGE